MKHEIKVGDEVRESGADLRMTVEAIDGDVATCRYPEPGHPEADGEGMRAGPFALSQLRPFDWKPKHPV